jgi:hypothetical protein
MVKFKISDYIRWLLTIYLLYVVWNNSHLSVAIAITLLIITNEITTVSLQMVISSIKKIVNL